MTNTFKKILFLSLGLLVAAPVAGAFAPATAQSGIASMYGRGDGYGGRRTASGERMNPNAYTAAHRRLPFGTQVQVTNRRNGRSVVVRINDRGPYGRNRSRILD
ncbi:MAG: septal ring lytic transglycosylase RlpA family protein, partial [Pseudomonadota bacterium]